ncbi:hypothetical protein SAMN05414139_07081 [Burkholderia sp. D7]|jgi:hypothetical protein|nr:hypothetical protein SAMN05414139_07081 [Burkholderia sp. D7]
MDGQTAAVAWELLMARRGFARVRGYAPLAWSTLVESRHCRKSTMGCPPDDLLMQIKQTGQTDGQIRTARRFPLWVVSPVTGWLT